MLDNARTCDTGRWRKRGLVFTAAGGDSWMRSHAALPTAFPRGDGCVDVYFCSRDEQSRSQIGRFTFDPRRPGVIHSVSESPLLAIGPIGAFDDSGVTPACVLRRNNAIYLYYTGWMLGRTVPFYYAVGLAVSDDDGRTFQRASRGPILDRNDVDPYLTASPFVTREGDAWRMWYVSGDRWELHAGAPRHYYHVRYAESRDGIHWRRDGRVCIDFASAEEYAIARPSVIRSLSRKGIVGQASRLSLTGETPVPQPSGVGSNDARGYRMWFPHRGPSYRIGYAESLDGLTWRRDDRRSGIDVSPDGWDSEMVTYPSVFDCGGVRYMLYNGNGYGQSGIGLAEWVAGSEKDES